VSILPLFPLDLVLLPETPLPLHIFEPRYKLMVGECLQAREPFGVLRASEEDMVRIGCTAEIIDVLRTYPDGRMDILTMGRKRFHILEVDQSMDFLRGEVEYLDDLEDGIPDPAAISSVMTLHRALIDLLGRDKETVEQDAPMLSYRLANMLPVDLEFKQQLLELRSEKGRIETLIAFYRKAVPKLKMHRTGQTKSSTNGWIH
jgi:Lon protease-like protein